ncbi:hypothetical protein N9933_00990 [bacterium]|nr:hypothetical protein [bacterium]
MLKRLKQWTSLKANEKLRRTGNPFWHKESYDHIIRNDKEYHHQIAYTLNNPVEAGLVEDWDCSFLL